MAFTISACRQKGIFIFLVAVVWLSLSLFSYGLVGGPPPLVNTMKTSFEKPSFGNNSFGNTSSGVCLRDPDMGHFVFVTSRCVVRVVNKVVIIAPVDPGSTTDVLTALKECTSLAVPTRMATQNESKDMLRECPVGRREDSLTMMYERHWDFHPYHSVLGPTGALQVFSVLNATQHFLAQNGLRLPLRMISIPTFRPETSPYRTHRPASRFMEYVLSYRYGEDASGGGTRPEDVHVTIPVMPPTNASCSLYHVIGLWQPNMLINYLHPSGLQGVSAPILPRTAMDFRAFREMVRSRSLRDYGDVPINTTTPVLYVPRKVDCEAAVSRVRFIPSAAVKVLGELFLRMTNSSAMEVDYFGGVLADYPKQFQSIRSRRIVLSPEGAFLTWMLVGRPETVWVMYYRTPYKHAKYRQHGFFTSMVRVLPDLKLVVYAVTNGVSPPMSELERAVREPFIPGVPKFVGADLMGNADNVPGHDPLECKCVDIL